MIDSIKEVFEFIGSYPTWAKVVLLTSLILIVFTLTFASRNTTKVDSKNTDIATIIEEKPSVDEFKAQLITQKDILLEHLKVLDYENLYIIHSLKVENITFDLAIYYHNDEMHQMGRRLLFLDFYELDGKKVDWEQIDKDWEIKNSSISFQKVKESLENINGFNYPLEYTSGDGSYRPRLIYIQLCGRRKSLKQSDISTMQDKNDFLKRNEMFRLIGTYDLLIDKFKPFL